MEKKKIIIIGIILLISIISFYLGHYLWPAEIDEEKACESIVIKQMIRSLDVCQESSNVKLELCETMINEAINKLCK